MRHVDDGRLHAWLDAELPDADAAAVASHLDDCARCRARLDDARAMRDQAGSLLEVVGPVVEVPDFEEVRARAGLKETGSRAGGGAGAGGWRRTVLVAGWAASVAMAVALGWMARDWAAPSEAPQVMALADGPAVGGGPGMVRDVVERRETSPGIAATPTRESAGDPLRAAPDVESEVASSTAAGPSPSAPAAALPPPPVAGGGRGSAAPSPDPRESDAASPGAPSASDGVQVDAMELQRPAAVPSAPPPPQTAAAPVAPAPEGQAAGAEAGTSAPRVLRLEELPSSLLEQPTLDVGSARATGMPLTGDLRAPVAGAFIWQPMPRTEAAVRTGMALYGLRDADPVDTAISPDATQVRTRYQLDSGDVVVLVQVRDATAPAAAPAVGRVQTAAASPLFRTGVDPAARRWVGMRGGMRLMLEVETGDTSPDELAARLRID